MKLFPKIETINPINGLFAWKRLQSFFTTLFQLLLAFFVLNQFDIASQSGINKVALIIISSFIIYSFVPIRFKPFIFSVISFVIIFYAFGWFGGSLIIATGIFILACCHLPIKHSLKIVLVILIFGGLAFIRSNHLYLPRAIAVSPYIATMFMFRVFIYLYELKYKSVPNATLWQQVGYFFMFPNNLFLLFPIVDYKSFIKSFYAHNEPSFWQKGIRWILRGMIHLMIYKLIYNNLVIPKEQVIDLNTLLIHASANYLLIFRLSGMFHIVVGLLCLFGFSLHPIFNNYFLATNFVNLWRRINIYWREFIMKLFFYPIIFKLKKINFKHSLPLTMMLMFFTTWLLHNYQWFWIRGNFPISVTDVLFWILIGSCVTINSIIEANNIKKKKTKVKDTLGKAISDILKMIGLFLFMAIMWTLWSSKNISEWLYLLSLSNSFITSDIIIITLVIIAAIIIGVIIKQLLKNQKLYALVNLSPEKTLFITLPSLLILTAISYQPIKNKLPIKLNKLISSLTISKMDSANKQKLEQGYYEKLLDGDGKDVTNLWEVEVKRTKTFSPLDEVAIRTTNLLTRTLQPNADIMLNGINLKTNNSGFRDKNYKLIKPNKTNRFAMLGGSYEMGMGVDKNKTFEYLVENKLNNTGLENNIELINFSMGGYHLIQHVEQINSNVVFQYNPDGLIYFAHTEDKRRLLRFVTDLIQNGTNLKYPFLIKIKQLSKAKQNMSRIEIEQRLKPFISYIVKWSYIQISKQSKAHNTKPIWIYLPATADEFSIDEYNELKSYAEQSGFYTINLIGIYNDINVNTIQLSEWDTHPNEKGHQLIANKLFEELIKHKQNLNLN